jgi:hypothetical protein
VTTYDPNPVVTINDVVIPADTVINRISLNFGRNDIFSQPQPAYASLELWVDAELALNVDLSDPITIDVDAATTGTKRMFTGVISDIQIKLGGFGATGGYAIYTITGVSALANLNKRTAGEAGFAKEYEGTRIYNICYEAFITSWSELSATPWELLPISGSWDTYEGSSITLVNDLATDIDQPPRPQYELHSYNDGITNALSLAQEAAQSGRGILYDAADGSLHYDDFLRRLERTPVSLTADEILVDGLTTDAQWSEIVNEATVTYKANAEESWRDEQSTQLYGELYGTRSTQLENLTDAYNQAFAFIEARAYPRMYPNTISVALHSPTVSDAKRDQLLDVFCGTPLSVTGLPSVFGILFQGFVENYKWEIKEKEAFLTMGNSSLKESYPSIIWLQVEPALTWATYPPLVEWEDV